MRLYAAFEIYDCAGNGNSIDIRHTRVPEGTTSEAIVAQLASGNSSFDIVQVDYDTLHKLIDQGLIYHLDQAYDFFRDTYQLFDFRDDYIELASRDGHIYGIPATVDAPLIFFDAIALDQFDIPSTFATYSDLIDFCSTVTSTTQTDSSNQDRTLTADVFTHPLVIPLASPEERAKQFGNILRSLGGSWLNEDGTAAFADQAGVEALTILRDAAQSCMGQAGLDYSQEDAIRAIHNREIAAAVLDSSNARFIYAQRDTTLWVQYEQHLKNIVETEGETNCAGRFLPDTDIGLETGIPIPAVGIGPDELTLDNPGEQNQFEPGEQNPDEGVPTPTTESTTTTITIPEIPCNEVLGDLETKYASLQAPIKYSLLPKAASNDNPIASSTEAKFFVFPRNSKITNALAIQLIMESTDKDSQESIKYFGTPVRYSTTPTALEYRTFNSESVVSPTNYDTTFFAVASGLSPEVNTPQLSLAKEIVGEALAQLLDSDVSPSDILAQASQDYESQNEAQNSQ